MDHYKVILRQFQVEMDRQQLSVKQLCGMTYLSRYMCGEYLKGSRRMSRKAVWAFYNVLFIRDPQEALADLIRAVYDNGQDERHHEDVYKLLLRKRESDGRTLTDISLAVTGHGTTLSAIFAKSTNATYLQPQSITLLCRLYDFTEDEMDTLWAATAYGSWEKFHLTYDALSPIQSEHPLIRRGNWATPTALIGMLRYLLEVSSDGLKVLLGTTSIHSTSRPPKGDVSAAIAYRLLCSEYAIGPIPERMLVDIVKATWPEVYWDAIPEHRL